MAQAQRYKLKLTKLEFCSLVDQPAQPNAKTLLIKRKRAGDEIAATARLAKVEDELGLAFFWAFTSTNTDGSEHYDLQGDNVTEFVKAAMEYMTESGGAVDEMHDSVATARVVFAMPLTPDIAKAYGLTTKQFGLMIAIKPTAEQLAKLKSGELNGVSIAGLGERVPVDKAKRRLAKQVLLTSETDGHQHAIDLDDPAGWCGDRLQTTYANSDGADVAHAHVWTFDGQTGAITIGADSGHAHTVDGTVPASVLAVFALNEQAEAKENAADVLERVLDGEADAGAVSVTIAARAPRTKSTPTTKTTHPGVISKETTPMNLAKMLATVLAMTASQQAYVAKLAPEELEPFLSKPTHERDAILKAAADADPVVFKGELTGLEVRKSDGELARKTAEKAEDLEKRNRDQAETIAKRDEAIEKAEIRKRAAETIGKLAGADAVHDLIIRSVLKSGAKQEEIDAAFTAMKGWNALGAEKSVAKGSGGQGDPAPADKKSAYAALEKGLMTFCEEQKIAKVWAWTDGLDAFVKTDAGKALYNAHAAAK